MSKIYKAFIENEQVIRKIAGKYFRQAEDIEDMVQETFLKSFSAEIKQEIHNPKAYLFQVAKNVCLSNIKKKYNKTTNSVEDFGGLEVYKDEGLVSAEDQLDSRRKLFVLSQALASLTPEYRRVIIMRKIDGLKFRQIALRLDVSVSTVEKRMAYALLRCNEFLRQNGYEHHEFGGTAQKPEKRGKNVFIIKSSASKPD